MKHPIQIFRAFFPILILIAGGMIMVWAGVNDIPYVTSIFGAMMEMKWFGWIGVAVQVFALLLLAGIVKLKWPND